jgi:hypothetical protein
MDRDGLDKAIAQLIERLGESGIGYSAVLYGSAARGDWAPGSSDVNLLVVVDDASPMGLRRLTPAVTAWHDAGFTPPLILGRLEWRRAVDVFPIEITDMRSAYRLLGGSDPVQDLDVDPADLRRALETELRGKLLRLRQAYVRYGETPVTLGKFAAASISSVLVLLRATAVLEGINAPETAAEIVAALGSALGPDSAAVLEVAAHRRDKKWACAPETFVRYLETVRCAVDVVDQYQRGDA